MSFEYISKKQDKGAQELKKYERPIDNWTLIQMFPPKTDEMYADMQSEIKKPESTELSVVKTIKTIIFRRRISL